jgi:hypothetical protein
LKENKESAFNTEFNSKLKWDHTFFITTTIKKDKNGQFEPKKIKFYLSTKTVNKVAYSEKENLSKYISNDGEEKITDKNIVLYFKSNVCLLDITITSKIVNTEDDLDDTDDDLSDIEFSETTKGLDSKRTIKNGLNQIEALIRNMILEKDKESTNQKYVHSNEMKKINTKEEYKKMESVNILQKESLEKIADERMYLKKMIEDMKNEIKENERIFREENEILKNRIKDFDVIIKNNKEEIMILTKLNESLKIEVSIKNEIIETIRKNRDNN